MPLALAKDCHTPGRGGEAKQGAQFCPNINGINGLQQGPWVKSKVWFMPQGKSGREGNPGQSAPAWG